jgi:uncharacterized protein YPO0396
VQRHIENDQAAQAFVQRHIENDQAAQAFVQRLKDVAAAPSKRSTSLRRQRPTREPTSATIHRFRQTTHNAFLSKPDISKKDLTVYYHYYC